MANTYYDSQLTAAEIEAALEAIDGVIVPTNNGKVLAINNGKFEARSVQWGGGSAVLEPLSVIENGDYYPEAGVDGFDEVHVAVPSGSPTIQSLSVNQNGTYTAPSGVDGYSPVVVNVSGGGGGSTWRDSFSVNWDFSNPVNTRGQTRYSNIGLIYSLDGWQLQGGTLDIVSGGIKLSRYSSGTNGYFMQRYKVTPTNAFIGKQMIMTAIVDGVLNSFITTMTSGSGGKGNMTVNGVTVRFYNYGSEVALTIDIANGNEDKIIQAVKFETGSEQTLATQINGIWVLNQQMDSNTELIKIGEDLVYN